jgi:hypothetical protein
VWLLIAVPVLLLAIDVSMSDRGAGLVRSREAALALLGLLFVGNVTALGILVVGLVTTRAADLGRGGAPPVWAVPEVVRVDADAYSPVVDLIHEFERLGKGVDEVDLVTSDRLDRQLHVACLIKDSSSAARDCSKTVRSERPCSGPGTTSRQSPPR